MGAAESGFATMQSTLVLLSAPERLRGAAMGILSACIGTQPLGTLAIGLLAASLGSPRAFTINAARLPRRHRPPRHPPHPPPHLNHFLKPTNPQLKKILSSQGLTVISDAIGPAAALWAQFSADASRTERVGPWRAAPEGVDETRFPPKGNRPHGTMESASADGGIRPSWSSDPLRGRPPRTG